MPVRFDSINLVVTDMDATRAFYERLGLDFSNAHRSPQPPPT